MAKRSTDALAKTTISPTSKKRERERERKKESKCGVEISSHKVPLQTAASGSKLRDDRQIWLSLGRFPFSFCLSFSSTFSNSVSLHSR